MPVANHFYEVQRKDDSQKIVYAKRVTMEICVYNALQTNSIYSIHSILVRAHSLLLLYKYAEYNYK